MTFISAITDNIAFLQEYLLRIGRQKYRLQYRQERLLRERAMIEIELRHIANEIASCENEEKGVQASIAYKKQQ